MVQRRSLPLSTNGFNLRPMVAAVIYVRVSTKEQTENLSLPTQLRACEEYCRRDCYEVRERFTEQGESAKTTDRTELQRLLNYCRTHKGKVHFVVVYNIPRFAREEYDHFALRALLEVAGDLAALRDRADRRHVDRKADGRRTRRLRAIRQRRPGRPHASRDAGRARAGSLDLHPPTWLPERAEMVRQESGARP